MLATLSEGEIEMQIFRIPDGQGYKYPKVEQAADKKKQKHHQEEEKKQKKKGGMDSILEHLADNISQHAE